MSPYVGMDDNPVALCDPYGLATGDTTCEVVVGEAIIGDLEISGDCLEIQVLKQRHLNIQLCIAIPVVLIMLRIELRLKLPCIEDFSV